MREGILDSLFPSMQLEILHPRQQAFTNIWVIGVGARFHENTAEKHYYSQENKMPNSFDITKPEEAHRGHLWYQKKNPSEQSTEAGEAFLNSFKFSIFIDSDDVGDPAHQICLLTIVNAASRISLESKSVQVFGAKGHQRNDNSGLSGTLEDAINELGGTCELVHDTSETLGIMIGKVNPSTSCLFCIRAVFEGWRGGIVPSKDSNPFKATSPIPLGAILAAGLAVYECFRFVIKDGSAVGYIATGMSLWNLKEKDWFQTDSQEPQTIDKMSSMWFCGLGHLGQAYIWTLGHLPIPNKLKRANQVTIQDEDLTSLSSLSTSLLSTKEAMNVSKVQVCNNWLQDRGFSQVNSIIKYLDEESVIGFGKAQVICGFDNRWARRQAASKNPVLMIDGGIGGKPDDIQTISMTVLPSSIDPKIKWTGSDEGFITEQSEAFKALEAEGKIDACGLKTLNNKAVGFPFVGVVTASIVISELLRRNHGGEEFSTVSLDMLDISLRNCD